MSKNYLWFIAALFGGMIAAVIISMLVWAGASFFAYRAEQNAHAELCELAGGVYERQGGYEQCWSIEKGTRLFPWIAR